MKKTKKRKIHPLQVIPHIGAWIPFIILAIDYSNNNLTVNPIQEATLRTGRTALTLLVLSLACTPINIIFSYKPVLKLSRPLGVYSFFYALLHFYIFIGVDYGFNWGFFAEAFLEKRFTLIGGAAFLILLALAITSTDGWKRRLKKNWKRLHRFVYLAIALVITHFIWSVKSDYRLALVYGAIALILLIIRVPVIRKRILRK